MSGRRSKKQRVDDDGPVLMKGQTQQERQQIRAQQREIGAQIAAQGASIADVTSSTFLDLRDANNKLLVQANHMRESVLDVQNMYDLTHAATKQAAALAVVNQAVSCDRLIKELRKRGLKDEDDHEGDEESGGGGEGVFDWASLGRAVGPFFATVPSVEFLCGPISKPEVARKERGKRKSNARDDEEEGEAKNERPENITSKDEDLVESTQARLKVLGERLPLAGSGPPTSSSSSSSISSSIYGGPVGFYDFIVNPKSFTQTVENIFDLSFMVKQGTAALSVKDGLPVINKLPKVEDEAREQQSHQLVMSLCPADMRRAVELFNCRGEGIPHRQDKTYDPSFQG